MDELDRTTSLSEPPTPAEPAPLSRASRVGGARSSRWLLGVGLGGLLLVPVVGTVYLGVADFGGGEAATIGSSAPRLRARAPGAPGAITDDDGEDGASADPRTRPGTGEGPSSTRREAKPRTDGAVLCCTKLRELGKGAPLDTRASYLAAATACDAAPSADRAFKQVQSVLGGSRVEIPDECTRD